MGRLFGGETMPLMHHLMQEREMSKADIEELRKLVKQLKEASSDGNARTDFLPCDHSGNRRSIRLRPITLQRFSEDVPRSQGTRNGFYSDSATNRPRSVDHLYNACGVRRLGRVTQGAPLAVANAASLDDRWASG